MYQCMKKMAALRVRLYSWVNYIQNWKNRDIYCVDQMTITYDMKYWHLSTKEKFKSIILFTWNFKSKSHKVRWKWLQFMKYSIHSPLYFYPLCTSIFGEVSMSSSYWLLSYKPKTFSHHLPELYTIKVYHKEIWIKLFYFSLKIDFEFTRNLLALRDQVKFCTQSC